MRCSIIFFLSMVTGLVIHDGDNNLYVRNMQIRAPTKAPTKLSGSSSSLTQAPQQGSVRPTLTTENKPKQQSEVGRTIAQKSRLLNPDIDHRVQQGLSKDAAQTEKKALKDKQPPGSSQKPLQTEERRLNGKPLYPASQRFKDTFTAHNPFANPEKKAAAKDRKLEQKYKKTPSDIQYEDKRNKLAGQDNTRNKEYYDHCRNKKDEFDNKTKKISMGLEVASTIGHLTGRDVSHLRRRMIKEHLVGLTLLRRDGC